MYRLFHQHFVNQLDKVGLNGRKRDQRRRKITLHSLRRFVKSTISDVDPDFSEYILGHKGSVYWTKKPEQNRQKYIKCMKYLTFLDYEAVERLGKEVESQLQKKDLEIREIKNDLVVLKKFKMDYYTTVVDNIHDLERYKEAYIERFGDIPKKKSKMKN